MRTGRPWNDLATTVYLRTFMDDTVNPIGWTPFDSARSVFLSISLLFVHSQTITYSLYLKARHNEYDLLRGVRQLRWVVVTICTLFARYIFTCPLC